LWPISAIALTKQEYKHIMILAISHVLAKLKIVKTIKRKLIYGPTYIQGMGLKNLYTLLGAVHLALIIKFYDTDTDLGQLLKNSLEYLMMELGMPDKFFGV